MRKLPAVAVAGLILPAAANASEGGGLDLVGSLAQTAGSLILVIGIILILYYLAGRLMKVPQGGKARHIRVVETRHLAPKKSLLLVEVGGEYLLLSNSGEGITFLKQVEMLEDIEVVEEHAAAALIPARLKEKLKAFAAELPAGASRLASCKKSGGFA